MAMPLGKLDLLAGYGIAFGLMACVQVTLVLVVSLTWLGVTLPGSAVPMAVVAVLDAVLGMACGLFASAFARTEFQAVQFMPAFVLPQALLCGLVVSRDQMTAVLRWLSDVLPLSYAVDAMQRHHRRGRVDERGQRGRGGHPRVHRRRPGRRRAHAAAAHVITTFPAGAGSRPRRGGGGAAGEPLLGSRGFPPRPRGAWDQVRRAGAYGRWSCWRLVCVVSPELVAQDVKVAFQSVVAEGLGVGEQDFDGEEAGGVGGRCGVRGCGVHGGSPS